MLNKILIGLAAVLAVLIVAIALQPDEFRVTRSTTINASPARVFAVVNNMRKWNDWSPWAKLDPNAKSSFEGPSRGVGAAMSWDGNHEVGAGKMTITESRPVERIVMRLDFEKPFKATNTTEFTLKREGRQTLVTWSMFGKSDFLAKAISFFMNCEKMVGDQFEKGLANLNTVVTGRK